MRVAHISQHFRHRWRQRVGRWPSIGGLNYLLSTAIQVREQREVAGETVLAEFSIGHPYNIVVRIDTARSRAVTVLNARRDRIDRRLRRMSERDWKKAAP